MDVVEHLRSLGGAARFRELGTSRYQLRRLVEAGLIERPGVGCYALPGAPREYLAATRLDGAVSCVSALKQFGLMTYGTEGGVHVSVPSNRGTHGRPVNGVVRHFEDVPRLDGKRCVPVLAAAARAASCLPYDQAVATLDQVLRHAHGLRVRDARDKLVHAVRASDTRLAAALDIDLNPRARALRESECRLVLRRAGLAAVPGVELPMIGEVDLFVEGIAIIEIDGFEFHKDRSAFRVDRRRDRAAQALGLVVLRFAWEDSDPLSVVDVVRSRLATIESPLPCAADVPEWARASLEEAQLAARALDARAVGARLFGSRGRRGVVWPPTRSA